MATHKSAPDRDGDHAGTTISVQTLIIASVASAAASFLASRLWGGGTLVSAALTPIVVALVSEFLRRPVRTVAQTAKKVPAVYSLPAHKSTTAAPQDTTQDDPDEPAPAAVPDAAQSQARGRPGGLAQTTWRPRWRLVFATGLLAFAIVVVVFTVPELVAGRSVTGNGEPTTFFGSSTSATKKSSPSVTTTTSTTITPTTTVTKTSSTTTTTSKTTTTPPPTSTSTSPTGAVTTPTTSTAPSGANGTTTSTTPSP